MDGRRSTHRRESVDCEEQGRKKKCLIEGGVSLKQKSEGKRKRTLEKGAGRREQTYTNPLSAPALGLFILQIELSANLI